MQAEQLLAAWCNSNASDYESGECRFDPCGNHFFAITSGSVAFDPFYFRMS